MAIGFNKGGVYSYAPTIGPGGTIINTNARGGGMPTPTDAGGAYVDPNASFQEQQRQLELQRQEAARQAELQRQAQGEANRLARLQRIKTAIYREQQGQQQQRLLSQSDLDVLRSQGVDVFNPKVLRTLSTYEQGKEPIPTTITTQEIPSQTFSGIPNQQQQNFNATNIKKYGPVTSGLNYIGAKARGVVKEQPLGLMSDYLPFEVKGSGLYDSLTGSFNPVISKEEISKRIALKTEATKQGASQTAMTLPFLTPAGPYLLAATGAESILFPGGREQIQQIGEKLQAKGIPKELAWGIPAGEIALGLYGIPKVRGLIRTAGNQGEVLFPEYKTNFPEAGKGLSSLQTAKLHKEIFLSAKNVPSGYGAGGYHAYSTPLISDVVESPLHISSQTSYHFLGVGNGYNPSFFDKTFGGTLNMFAGEGIGGKPGALFVEPTSFEVNVGTEVKRGVYAWTNPTKTGIAYLPGTKAEIQAVFTPKTQLLKTGGKFYFKYGGVRYPIDTFKTLSTGKGIGLFEDILPNYQGVSSYSTASSKSGSLLSSLLYSTGPTKSTTSSPKYLKTSTPKTPRISISSHTQPRDYSPSMPISPSIPLSILSPPTSPYKKPSPFYPTKPTTRTKNLTYFPSTAKAQKGIFSFKKVMQMPKGVFSVSVRRGGKFRPVGIFESYQKAFQKGVSVSDLTLARSFKVSGTSGGTQLPKTYYRSGREPGVIIQKRKFSLSAPTEKSEIQYFRKLFKKSTLKSSNKNNKKKFKI